MKIITKLAQLLFIFQCLINKLLVLIVLHIKVVLVADIRHEIRSVYCITANFPAILKCTFLQLIKKFK